MTGIDPATKRDLTVLGVRMKIHMTGKDTGGAYSLMEQTVPPGGGPQFLHTHPAQESICIRDGEFEVYSKGPKGKEAHRAGAGDVHHVAPLGAHGLKNVGKVDGRIFVVFHPADLQEKFFRDMDEYHLRNPGKPDLQKVAAIMERHNLVLLEKPE